MPKHSCVRTNTTVLKGMKLVALENQFFLTRGRVYVARSNQGDGTYFDCVKVINDRGVEHSYTLEYFSPFDDDLDV